MTRAFHAACPYADKIPLVEDDFRSFCNTLQKGGQGAVFVADGDDGLVGMIGGQSGPCFFNFGAKAAMENFIWSERKGVGRELVGALEEWARGIGCFSLAFVSQAAMKDAGPFYERLGYARNETSYLKVL
jgi:GNAT superfamily N-acetyltransferase